MWLGVTWGGGAVLAQAKRGPSLSTARIEAEQPPPVCPTPLVDYLQNLLIRSCPLCVGNQGMSVDENLALLAISSDLSTVA